LLGCCGHRRWGLDRARPPFAASHKQSAISLTTAACGGLRSTPDCRPRRAFLHLSYSYAPPFGPAILVTQDPSRKWSVQCSSRENGDFCGGLGAILGYRDQTPTSTLNRMTGCLMQSGPALRTQPSGETDSQRNEVKATARAVGRNSILGHGKFVSIVLQGPVREQQMKPNTPDPRRMLSTLR
jgi:hypothetical protein